MSNKRSHCKACGKPIPRIACYSQERVSCSGYCEKQLMRASIRPNKNELYRKLRNPTIVKRVKEKRKASEV
jgi:predicted nucleic acid-binding Zn ribbon protein